MGLIGELAGKKFSSGKSIIRRDSYGAGKDNAGSRITIGTKLFFR